MNKPKPWVKYKRIPGTKGDEWIYICRKCAARMPYQFIHDHAWQKHGRHEVKIV